MPQRRTQKLLKARSSFIVVKYDCTLPPPDYEAVRRYVSKVHTGRMRRAILGMHIPVKTSLGKFDEGPWFIHLQPLGPFPYLTPEHFFIGTHSPGTPLHITIPHCPPDLSIAQLTEILSGVHDLELAEQWGTQRDQTGYLLKGDVLDLCHRLEEHGARPRGSWHLC